MSSKSTARCATAACAALFTMIAAQVASAKTCDLSIEGSDAMQYNVKELTVAKDCTDVKLTLKHSGKLPKAAMGHDWVLAAASDMQGIVADAMKAGLANNYLPQGDKRIIAFTQLVGGGETASTTFKVSDLKPGTEYKYFCTFPGHAGVMNGVLKVDGATAGKS
jgi:azurin